MGRLVLAVDPGQRIDPSAIVLAEELLPDRAPPQWRLPRRREIDGRDVIMVESPRPPTIFAVRHMERIHGEPYARVAKRVAEIANNASRLAPKEMLCVAVDATGLGRPVCETISNELHVAGVRCWVSAVVMTAGERLTGMLGDPEIRLSKSVMVSNLTALFEARRVKLPADHAEAEAMMRELLDYEIKVSKDGQDRYEGRIGSHDDLVVALGMACLGVWRRPVTVRGYGSGLVPFNP